MLYAFWQRIFHRILRPHIVVEGEELLPNEPFIVAGNHVDWLDGLLLAIALWGRTHKKICFLARANNWRIFGQSNVVITEDIHGAMEQLKRRLADGEIIGFFPEGYRNPAPELAKGRRGTVHFALLSNAPVVPFGIQSTSGRTIFHSLRNLFRTPVHIRFGHPIRYTAETNQADNKHIQDSLTQDLMEIISALSSKPYPYQRI